MTFLNISDTFGGWGDMSHGALWAYNLNYFDWLMQDGMTAGEGAKWIDRFIEGLQYNHIGLDPYPTALRCINWIKFVCRHRDELDGEKIKCWNDALYSQCRLLEKSLEYHLLGNHLLEDAYSLCVGAVYFADERMWRKASRLLRQELAGQTLADGAHYEQSPMYHCIMLDRLLDVYNFSKSNPRFGEEQDALNEFLQEKAVAMLGHLEGMTYQDGTYPLFGDAAEGVASTPDELRTYARRLSLAWRPLPLKECGYRHLRAGTFEAFVDVGGIAASYQPGHSHADALNYELRIDNKPFIVDTGISTYDKTPRRQYERSTAAHNTVVVSGRDSAEVWGGFRVGRRPRVMVVTDTAKLITARHTGTSRNLWHGRSFSIDDDRFTVSDQVADKRHAVSYIHLAPNVKVYGSIEGKIRTDCATLFVDGATAIYVKRCEVSTEYNLLQTSTVIEIHFNGRCKYMIGKTSQQNNDEKSDACLRDTPGGNQDGSAREGA